MGIFLNYLSLDKWNFEIFPQPCINGKNFIASGTRVLQCVHELHDPVITLTYLQQGQHRLSMHLNGENC